MEKIMINGKCRCECEKYVCKKNYIWNPSTCSAENGKYLANIVDDSMIMCDEVIDSYNEETKTISTNFNERKAICETQNFYILIALLLITIALLNTIALIYCIRYVTIKDMKYAKINSVNPLYLIFSKVNEYLINKYK